MKQLICMVPALLFIACGTSREISQAEKEKTQESELRRFEADFRPSDYDPEISSKTSATKTNGSPTQPPAAGNEKVTLEEMVQGYRVQLYSTAIIDSAKARLSRVEGEFPGEWFYLEYDQPTYKIRAGNFLSRYEADRFAKLLIERGYKNAWAVPQRVFKNPPPPPPRQSQGF